MLTKNPAGYSKWFTDKAPDNCFVGSTVCNDYMFDTALYNLTNIHAKHKWLSIEPLMSKLHVSPLDFYGIEFVVIGGWSNKADYKKHPVNPEWIEEIVSACDKAGVKVWLKNNLKPLFNIGKDDWENHAFKIPNWASPQTESDKGFKMLRQELPEVKL
jgi:protein gp37